MNNFEKLILNNFTRAPFRIFFQMFYFGEKFAALFEAGRPVDQQQVDVLQLQVREDRVDVRLKILICQKSDFFNLFAIYLSLLVRVERVPHFRGYENVLALKVLK